MSLLREIGDADSEIEDMSHNGGIRACEKGGQWLEALSLARKIGEVMLETGVISYTASLGACEKGGNQPRTLLVAARVRRAASGQMRCR